MESHKMLAKLEAAQYSNQFQHWEPFQALTGQMSLRLKQLFLTQLYTTDPERGTSDGMNPPCEQVAAHVANAV